MRGGEYRGGEERGEEERREEGRGGEERSQGSDHSKSIYQCDVQTGAFYLFKRLAGSLKITQNITASSLLSETINQYTRCTINGPEI